MKRPHLVLCLFAGALFFSVLGSQAASLSISPDYFAVLRSGDARRLREALDGGASAEARDEKGNTALMHATVYGNLACMRLLLDRGANVNATNDAGATPLMRAAFDYEKLKLLVERGADVKARSAIGNSVLMLAARPHSSHRAVELLLAHGVDAAATNRFGANALMAAVAGGDIKSVRLLLKHGATVAAQGPPNPENFILGGGRSPLMWAAFRGEVEILNLLIEAGANVNGEDLLGTPLAQAAWSDQTAAARVLIERGAQVNQVDHGAGFAPLHWAASTEESSAEFVKLLLKHGADPNLGGGEPVDAFMDVLQTPLMLAKRRGDTATLATLMAAGATNETPDRVRAPALPARHLPARLDRETVRAAIAAAMPPLQQTAIASKKAFASHGSRQDCTSCHQQHLPLAATGLAKQQRIKLDQQAEKELIKIVAQGELKDREVDWQPLFHPDPVGTKGYTLLGYAAEQLPADELTDSAVHHLSAIQAKDGRWHNNLPRPPLQSGDIGATALAIHALQHYPLPGRKAELRDQVERARKWLWTAKAENTDGRVYQILGLAWAGESPRKLQPLANALISQQRTDGGWAQLPNLKSDAYATGQALYALRVGAGFKISDSAIERGRRYLLSTQLEDGTWHVVRRAFPFQPTMKSGFPHGRDSWISAAGTSWAVMALSLEEEIGTLALGGRKNGMD